MKISNARVYRNGRFERSSVEFSDKISAFDVEGGVDAHGAYLVPGFIDIHTHGAIGYDASDCPRRRDTRTRGLLRRARRDLILLHDYDHRRGRAGAGDAQYTRL